MTFVVVVACMTISVSAQSDWEKAVSHANRALELMDRNLPDAAIPEWDKAIVLAPNNTAYQYERVLCFVMSKKYDTALTMLQPIYRDTSLKDRGYQLMGNVHDMKDDSTNSLKYYREGLTAYPASGRLHYELGAAAFIARQRAVAMDWWLRGAKAEPSFATNYYWLCKVYAESRDRIWSVLYGEAFLNLERSTERTKEISKLLFDTWNASIRLGDTVDPINLCSDALLETPSPGGPSQMNFATAFEYTIATASQPHIPERGIRAALTLEQLVDIRTQFIRTWMQQGSDTVYVNDLLAFQTAVVRAGWIGEYLHWLFSYGDMKSMNAYYRKNEQRYDTFLAWFGQNQLSFDKPLCLGLSCP